MATTGVRFDGIWIGETQGYDMPAHHWEIQQNERYLRIATRWEGEPANSRNTFTAWIVEGEAAFTINSFKAVLVDPQHFIIYGWDTNDKRSGVGEAFDVVFSRPGIAELTAHAVWLRHPAARVTD